METPLEAARAPQLHAPAESLAGNLPAERANARNSHLRFDPKDIRENFDREPFAFAHDLHTLELFSPDRLLQLMRRFDTAPADYFVSASAPTADTEFFKVSHDLCKPSEALARLDREAIRVLLKRPENHDPAFRRLLDDLFAQVVELRPELKQQRIVRLEAGLFITSAASTTPFHFDPEINFFSQIEGEKEYHVYSPAALKARELEKFYLQGQVNIGQVDLRGRDSVHERVYKLRPGAGFHQPQNSPHWVQTQASRSISYAFVYETELTRLRGRARACNHFLRRAGIDPAEPGAYPSRDRVKSAAMRMVIPLRRMVGSKLRALRGRH
jgi:hypothetical protein